MQITTDLEAAATTLTTLSDELTPVGESIEPLMTDIEDLVMSDDPFGINSTLIADFFSINDTKLDGYEADVLNDLVTPFCVQESNIFKFEL